MFPKRIKHVFTSGMSTSEARKGKSLYTIVNDECQDTKYIYACIDIYEPMWNFTQTFSYIIYNNQYDQCA